MSDDLWYHRGREARMRNENRGKVDGRMSAASRAAFHRGWDDEASQRQQITEAQRDESRRTLARLKQWAANL